MVDGGENVEITWGTGPWDNFHQCDCLSTQDVEMVRGELLSKGFEKNSGVCDTGFASVHQCECLENSGSKTWVQVGLCLAQRVLNSSMQARGCLSR